MYGSKSWELGEADTTSRFVPHKGSPSSCALDTAIVPVPSILLLLVIPVIFLRRTSAVTYPTLVPKKWVHISYIALVVAAFGMGVLEVARSIAQKLGVGLLPITVIALAVVAVLLWQERQGRTRVLSFVRLQCYILDNPLMSAVAPMAVPVMLLVSHVHRVYRKDCSDASA